MTTKTYDAVVIGLGGAGLSAAVELVEAGKSVLVLEKGEDWGGASKWAAEGIFAVESKHQRNAGFYPTKDQAFKHLMEWSHWRNNGRLVRNFVNQSADTIEWLEEHGMKTVLTGNIQDYHWEDPGTYHMFVDKYDSFDRLVEYLKEKGGQVETKAAAKKLIMDNDQLAGVVYEQDGQDIEVATKTVFVADGGFIGNEEMVEKYVDQDVSDWFIAGEWKATGDGIRMVHEVGGQVRAIANFQNHNACVYPTFEAAGGEKGNYSINQIYSLPLLWINRRGERFTDEKAVYDSVLWGNVTMKQNGKYFSIVDQATLDRLKSEKVPMINAYTRYNAVREFIDNLDADELDNPAELSAQRSCEAVTGPLENLDADWQKAMDDGYVLKGDSLEDLAEKMGVPVENFKDNIQAYNQAVEDGYDPIFNKDARLLQFKVEEGPFYAIKVRSAVLGTIGGIEVDEYCRAIGENEQVIDGVYVVGANASGMYDNSYSDIEGVTCAFAWGSGRMAAHQALDYLK